MLNELLPTQRHRVPVVTEEMIEQEGKDFMDLLAKVKGDG
jgi:hypothetical protein